MPMDQASTRPTPGRPGRRATYFPKGRQLEGAAIEEVRALLAGEPRRKDLLIEHLHKIQDRFGHLSAAHLNALAAEMKLAQAEVYEVATFYHHFDVIKEGETGPAELTVRVCDSVTCELFGSTRLLDALPDLLGGTVRVVRAPCLGACDRAPVAVIGQRQVHKATPETVTAAVKGGESEPEVPPYKDLDAYLADGGYRILDDLKHGKRSRDDVLAAVEASDLRGLGGAGFPAARKWGFLNGTPKPRLIAVNADEGEPGTFKDRFCLETDPHRVLEGALIAAWTVEADEIYIYLRDEYAHIREILTNELARIGRAGLNGDVKLHLRRGAGAYICGEESAMLESIEGKRGLPRNRPPFPAQKGLFGRPTLINNVETLYWLREIIEKGGAWYEGEGRPHYYSVSGRVKEPGVKLAPLGITARELIEDHAGGMLDGHAFKGYLPGGASGGILPASLADLPLDFGTLAEHGCFIGSSAVVVFSDKDSIRDVAKNLLRFFEDESCGQCTPCRVGCEKMLGLMDKPAWDEGLIGELSATMTDASICGLGQAAPNPVLSALKFFSEEVS